MSDIYAGVGRDDLVNAEAVALELPSAGIGLRLLSGLLDLVIQVVLLVVVLIVVGFVTGGADDAVVATLGLVGVAGVIVGLPTLVLTLTRGRSPGKLATGLRVVRLDAGPIAFRQALMRSLVALVEVWTFSGVPALVCSLVDARGRRLGDLAAGTFVVRDRFRLALPRPVPMPPPLAGWARGADLAALPDDLALATRQLLARWETLTPGSRELLGTRLATEVARYAAPAPPAGTPAYAFLAAVLAERRERDSRRLQRESALRQRLTG